MSYDRKNQKDNRVYKSKPKDWYTSSKGNDFDFCEGSFELKWIDRKKPIMDYKTHVGKDVHNICYFFYDVLVKSKEIRKGLMDAFKENKTKEFIYNLLLELLPKDFKPKEDFLLKLKNFTIAEGERLYNLSKYMKMNHKNILKYFVPKQREIYLDDEEDMSSGVIDRIDNLPDIKFNKRTFKIAIGDIKTGKIPNQIRKQIEFNRDNPARAKKLKLPTRYRRQLAEYNLLYEKRYNVCKEDILNYIIFLGWEEGPIVIYEHLTKRTYKALANLKIKMRKAVRENRYNPKPYYKKCRACFMREHCPKYEKQREPSPFENQKKVIVVD